MYVAGDSSWLLFYIYVWKWSIALHAPQCIHHAVLFHNSHDPYNMHTTIFNGLIIISLKDVSLKVTNWHQCNKLLHEDERNTRFIRWDQLISHEAEGRVRYELVEPAKSRIKSHITVLTPHSNKILTKQQGKPCHLGIWCNPCSRPNSPSLTLLILAEDFQRN